MSGSYKYRCLGRTASGDRCKRRCGDEYSYCPIHENQRHDTTLLEVERDVQIEACECFKDGDSSQRLCGHSCVFNLENCCECTDMRALDIVTAPTRGDSYCAICNPRYTERLPPQQQQRIAIPVIFQIDGDRMELLNAIIEGIRRLREIH